EERHARDAKRARGVALLFLADLRQTLGGHRAIARALVAVGHDDVGDLAPILDELRDRSTGSELGIVRVRRHDQHALDLQSGSVVAGAVRPAWTACNKPTALFSRSSERKEFEQTSSAKPSVLWAAVSRSGRISCSTT